MAIYCISKNFFICGLYSIISLAFPNKSLINIYKDDEIIYFLNYIHNFLNPIKLQLVSHFSSNL